MSSSRIRFTTARDVFEAFKELGQIAPMPVGDVGPTDYARHLLGSRRPIHAMAYLAHLLPRREAVWWARQCVGAILGPSGADEAMQAVEAWVRAPEEERRRAALDIGNAGDRKRPTTWLALAAGRSGGSVAPPDKDPVAPRPVDCAQAANAAIVLAICTTNPKEFGSWIRACVEAGIRFAEGGDARPIVPSTRSR